MTRANPFADLGDFETDKPAKPVPSAAIEKIAEDSGFPSRKARTRAAEPVTIEVPSQPVQPIRQHRRRITGRNRQINIKTTEETIENLYRIADEMDEPLGAVLEMALEALEESRGNAKR